MTEQPKRPSGYKVHFVPRYYIHFLDRGMPRDEHPNFASALHTWRTFGAVPIKMYASDDEGEREHGDGLTAAELAQLTRDDEGPSWKDIYGDN